LTYYCGLNRGMNFKQMAVST